MIEQAIEPAALMLGSDKSRGYCLELICADLLAGASLDNGQPDILLQPISRFGKEIPVRLNTAEYEEMRLRILRRDSW